MKILKYIPVLVMLIAHAGFIKAQSEVDAYLKTVYKNHVIPGFSVVVVKDEKVWFTKGYGFESLNGQKNFTSNTVSAIGSLTKSLTALAVMQLVDDGKIDLDRHVIDYIPWFKTANKEKSDRITVRMLLNNTSGLYGGVNPSFDFTTKALENLAHTLEGVYIINEPGKSFEYSNVAFSIAGLLVSEVSGLKYSDYLEKNIFNPLKMSHSTVDPKKFQSLNSIYGHYYGISKAIPAGRNQNNESGEFIPAGSITRSSASDLGNYLLCLLNGGQFDGKTVVSAKGLEEMWKPNIGFYGLSKDEGGENANTSYCLGWMSSTIEGRKLIFHQGSTGTMSSCTMIDPVNKIAATILMNIDISFIDKYKYLSDINILNNVLRIAGGLNKSDYAIPLIADPTINSFELSNSRMGDYTGFYKFQRGDNFVFQGSEIRIRSIDKKYLELTSLKGNQILFQCKLDFVNESYAINRNLSASSSIRFKTNSEGNITGMYMNGSEFIRLSESYISRLQSVMSTDQKVSLKVPLEWKVQSDTSIRISDNKDLRLLIRSDESQSTTFDEFYKKYSGSQNLISKGIVCSQNFGNQIWQQSVFISGNENGKIQYIIFSTNSGTNKIFAQFSVSDGNLTEAIQSSINNIIESFDIQ